MKKLLCLLLTLALLFSLVPAALAEDIVIVDPVAEEPVPAAETEQSAPPRAEANSEKCGDDLYWELKSGVLTVGGSGDMWDYEKGAAPWYPSRDSIQKIVVRGGVTSIGDYAFMDCNYLTSVSLSNSVTFIGRYAFLDSQNLASITLPNGLEHIGGFAFLYSGLRSVTLPAGLENIGEAAFGYCYSLTEIKVAAGNGNFKSLDGVLFSKNGETLMCYPTGKSGSAYTVPAGVKYIDSMAFAGAALAEAVLPAGLQVVGFSAFEECHNLEKAALPEGLTTLASYCFSNCVALTEVTIPASVTFIYDAPFRGCTVLDAIEVAAGNEYFTSLDGVLLTKDGSELIEYPSGRRILGYSVPETVILIREEAFCRAAYLKELTLGPGLCSIGGLAFGYAPQLSVVRFEGAAPAFEEDDVFALDTTTVYYPDNDPSWTADVRQNYGGVLTWVAYTPLPAPVLWLDGMSTGGVRLAWAGGDGAEGFELQRRELNGRWESLRAVFGSDYLNGSVDMGGIYSYRVRGFADDVNSPWSNVLDVVFNPFSDVPSKGKTFEYVSWAYNNGIVNGTSETTFTPNAPCTRIQFVMMLWKLNGSPLVEGRNPFSDISGAKTTKAILWALDAGIINSGAKFDPDGNITRVQIVMILWKLAGSPEVSGKNPFTDVRGAKTTKAVLWAYQNGITKGVSETKFAPNKDCTRLQLVIFLYKYSGIA